MKTEKEMTLKAVALAAEGKLNRPEYENRAVTGVSTDSRDDAAGKLFVPFRGANFDGHDFIPDVFARGAAACLSEKELPNSAGPVIYVGDTKRALMRIAAYYRGLFDVNVVGVTGSTGKTTAKDMIAAVLSQRYTVLKTEGNFNNEIGLPLTIFRLTPATEYAVIEMGMSGFGEIRALSAVAKPQTAVITNIGVSHIENLGSREGILKAKAEIFESMPPDGAGVLYAGDDLLQTLKGTRKNLLFFGTEGENDFFATAVVYHGVRGVSFTLHQKNGGSIAVHVPVPGFHMVLNALAAAAVGANAGLTLAEIKAGIECFRPSGMRMDIFRIKSGATVINDTYNANPASVKAALDVLNHAEGEKICVLGDMLELGKFADDMHYETGRYAAKLNMDSILTFGEKSRLIHEGALSMIASFNSTSSARHFEDKEELTDYLRAQAAKDTTILIKASRGMKFEEITAQLQ